MAVLQNVKHEKFAQGMAKGKSQAEAYLDAGYKATPSAANTCGYRLFKNASVKARVDEIKGKAAAFAERGGKPAPMGRPSQYDPKYCDGIETFMRKGFTATAYAGYIGVSYTTLQNWCQEYPDFLAAYERAKAKRALEWEILGLKNAKDGVGGAPIIKFGLYNSARHEWASPESKTEGDGAGTGNTFIFNGGYQD